MRIFWQAGRVVVAIPGRVTHGLVQVEAAIGGEPGGGLELDVLTTVTAEVGHAWHSLGQVAPVEVPLTAVTVLPQKQVVMNRDMGPVTMGRPRWAGQFTVRSAGDASKVAPHLRQVRGRRNVVMGTSRGGSG